MSTYLIWAAAFLLAAAALSPQLIRWAFRAPRVREQGSPQDLGLAYETVAIATENGKNLFAWYIPPPKGGPAPAIAVLHGWGGNAEMLLPFAPFLHRAGYALLFMDARNHGQSDGDDFSSLVKFAQDLEHGLDWLENRPEVAPERVGVLAYSIGAAAALLAASRRRSLRAVVSIAAFAHPELTMRRIMARHHVPYWPVGWWVLRYVEKSIGATFDHIAPCLTIRRVACPVLLIHGERDQHVPLLDAHRIYRNRRSNAVRLWVIPDTGHDSADQIQRHGREVAAFFEEAV